MPIFHSRQNTELSTHDKVLKAAQKLFARNGYDGTTTKELAETAGIAEGTLFRHFTNKKAILVEVATNGWIELLTDLLTELSEMANYEAISHVMYKRMLRLGDNYDMMRVCFMEVQLHPDLRDRIQSEVIEKMTNVAEAFFQTAMERGVYRRMNPRVIAQVFLGMFVVAGFSHETIAQPVASPQEMKEMAEGLADIFLNGVLAKK
ncbi:TetR/AcrR family transcriptional regulator [Chamaesiphon sp.]|uniref:TetR/AcrR family transcriptional regulator n=1 Tax=Chamaesiphon sp. TaxID=2814140 RepID=UPI00359375A3